jgi:hypothetical protein
MSYKGECALPLPELESTRRLREGGPGSGPHQGGKKSKNIGRSYAAVLANHGFKHVGGDVYKKKGHVVRLDSQGFTHNSSKEPDSTDEGYGVRRLHDLLSERGA